jgi:hypothetical protein
MSLFNNKTDKVHSLLTLKRLPTVWKGGKRGSDCLHDPNGFTYSCYVDQRMKSAAHRYPSDSGAYWRCSMRKPLVMGRKKWISCGFMLHEKNGTFRNVSTGHHRHTANINQNTCRRCAANRQFIQML